MQISSQDFGAGNSRSAVLIYLHRRLGNGGGGIRTHEGLSSLPVFKTGAFNHSATPPGVMNQAVLVVESIVPGAAIVQLCPPFFVPEIEPPRLVHGFDILSLESVRVNPERDAGT
jgi:hypothetical protein